MLQPTGPQAGAWRDAPPPPTRAAAGRDMSRATFRLLHLGQRTSASSELRMTSSSKLFWHPAQAYS
jgi:hypothetical protein